MAAWLADRLLITAAKKRDNNNIAIRRRLSIYLIVYSNTACIVIIIIIIIIIIVVVIIVVVRIWRNHHSIICRRFKNLHWSFIPLIFHRLSMPSPYTVTWQLTIAYFKCNTMPLGAHFGPARDLPELHIADYHLNNVTSLIDLGVKFDNQLKFSDHIHGITNRAYQRSNLIFRCFLSKDLYSLVRAYKTYVRPLLEYNSVEWSPSQICLINAIEAVQRAFAKRLPSFQNLSYPERITNLQLQTLEHRRLVTDLYTCHCIIDGHSALQLNDFFTNSHRSNLRGHSNKL